MLAAPAKRQEAAPAVVPVTAVPAAAAVAEAKQAAAAAAAEAEAKWAAAAAAAAEAEDEAKRAARSGVVLGAAPPRKQEIKLSPQVGGRRWRRHPGLLRSRKCAAGAHPLLRRQPPPPLCAPPPPACRPRPRWAA